MCKEIKQKYSNVMARKCHFCSLLFKTKPTFSMLPWLPSRNKKERVTMPHICFNVYENLGFISIVVAENEMPLSIYVVLLL